MRLGEIMDRAELPVLLDKLIALSRKDLVKWECINYDTPTKIPTGETREICLIQSIQMRGEYINKVFGLVLTELFNFPLRDAEIVISFQHHGASVTSYESEEKNKRRSKTVGKYGRPGNNGV